MDQLNIDFKESIPVGQLGIIPLESSRELGQKVNEYIISWRNERQSTNQGNILFENYKKITTSLTPNVPVSVPVRQRVPFMNPFEAKTCISSLT